MSSSRSPGFSEIPVNALNGKTRMTEASPQGKKPAARKPAKKTAATKPEAKAPGRQTVEEKAAGAGKRTASAAASTGAAVPPKKKAPSRDRRQTVKGRRNDDKIMPGLLRNLEGVFDKIHSDNRKRDRTQEQIAEDFAVQLQQTFKEMHSQLEEREQLLDAKLKSIDRTHNYQLKRFKLMSIPVTVLSVVAVVYLFYVVRVMETAMTSMSQDMHEITAYMDVMSVNTHALTENTAHISGQMAAMNRNIGNMNTTVNNLGYDVHNMARSVSPAMSSMNRFMP